MSDELETTMPYKHGEVCEHGLLKRKCDVCLLNYDLDEWRQRALQAEADRDTLAAEVRAWRKWKSRVMRYITAEMPDPQPIIDNLKKSTVATDDSGALDRAKEAKR